MYMDTYPREVKAAQEERKSDFGSLSRLALVTGQDRMWRTAERIHITVDEMTESHRAATLARLVRQADTYLRAARDQDLVDEDVTDADAWMRQQPLFVAMMAAQGLPTACDPQPGDWVRCVDTQFDLSGEVTVTPFDLGMVINGVARRPRDRSEFRVPRVRVRFTTGVDTWVKADELVVAPEPSDPLAPTRPPAVKVADDYYVQLAPTG